jgi:1,4-alpha-glucan branching enzyme
MISLVRNSKLIDVPEVNRVYDHKGNEILAYSRGNYLFVFNFNPTQSFVDYGIPIAASKFRIVLNTDEDRFGGQNRIDKELIYSTHPSGGLNSQQYLLLYLPARTAIILEKQD